MNTFHVAEYKYLLPVPCRQMGDTKYAASKFDLAKKLLAGTINGRDYSGALREGGTPRRTPASSQHCFPDLPAPAFCPGGSLTCQQLLPVPIFLLTCPLPRVRFTHTHPPPAACFTDSDPAVCPSPSLCADFLTTLCYDHIVTIQPASRM